MTSTATSTSSFQTTLLSRLTSRMSMERMLILVMMLMLGQICHCDCLNLEEGDPCPTTDYRSTCLSPDRCPLLAEYFDKGILTAQTVTNCGFTSFGEKICCPIPSTTTAATKSTSTTTTTTTTTSTTTTTTISPRIEEDWWLSVFNTTDNFLPPNDTKPVDPPVADIFSIFNTDSNFEWNNRVNQTQGDSHETKNRLNPSTEGINNDVQKRSTTPNIHDRHSAIMVGVPFFQFPGPTAQSEGKQCRTKLYQGICLRTSQCKIVENLIDEGRLQSEEVEICSRGVFEEIICCPLNVAIDPRDGVPMTTSTILPITRPLTTTQATTIENPVITEFDSDAIHNASVALGPKYTHLAALAYLNSDADGFNHRCTATVLTNQLLATSAGCSNADNQAKRPYHAVFGVADLRDADTETDYNLEIGPSHYNRGDLALLQLAKPIELGDAVNIAPLCSQSEQTRQLAISELRASAWALGNTSECALYEMPMRLLPSDECEKLSNMRDIPNLGRAYICVGPKGRDPPASLQPENCSLCPAAVGSVLHMVRDNDSRCVLGIATSTSTDCHASAIAYTSLIDPQFAEFIGQTVRAMAAQ